MAVGVTLAAVAVVGAVAKGIGASKAAKHREKMAEDQARYTYAARMEQIRRAGEQLAQVEGTAVASGYSSGVLMAGSTKRYIDSLRSEHTRQLTFAQGAASEERRQILKGGQSPGLNMQLVGIAADGISNAVGGYMAGSNYSSGTP